MPAILYSCWACLLAFSAWWRAVSCSLVALWAFCCCRPGSVIPSAMASEMAAT